ncbi:hypothetical protein [Thalassolituus sp.]|uniref:hypothetical protein n=1 Tax=Thalassolituus sp. TaxID=2030822 RepID=UPI002602E2EC|nr:hypothetical protein [Thalassolituus sp.]
MWGDGHPGSDGPNLPDVEIKLTLGEACALFESLGLVAQKVEEHRDDLFTPVDSCLKAVGEARKKLGNAIEESTAYIFDE